MVVTSGVLVSLFSWKLGVFESIAMTISVGLSCDFTAHHAVEFTKRHSVLAIIEPTFFSAFTTVTMGLTMYIFSHVLVYQQIGAFFFVLVTISWFYSVFFLNPVLEGLDYVYNFVKKRMRLGFKSKPKYSYYRDNCNIGGIQTEENDEEEESNGSNLVISRLETELRVPLREHVSEKVSRKWSSEVKIPERVQREINTMEKWKSLKKLSQETPV